MIDCNLPFVQDPHTSRRPWSMRTKTSRQPATVCEDLGLCVGHSCLQYGRPTGKSPGPFAVHPVHRSLLPPITPQPSTKVLLTTLLSSALSGMGTTEPTENLLRTLWTDASRSTIHPLSSAYPGPGCGGRCLSRDTQTSFSPDTSSSSSGRIPRRSQASWVT